MKYNFVPIDWVELDVWMDLDPFNSCHEQQNGCRFLNSNGQDYTIARAKYNLNLYSAQMLLDLLQFLAMSRTVIIPYLCLTNEGGVHGE